MLRVDPASKTLVPVTSTTLTQSNILERAGLQEAIIRSWDAFCSEMGYEELFLIGSEVEPHDSCRDRIDILALSRDGRPIVFELKRHRDRLQLLQAISYASMIAKWDTSRFRKELGGKDDEDTEELRSLLSDDAFVLEGPEIVLIAESFEPEVILASDWLAGFGVPISAFAVSSVEHRGDTLISLDQKFPLAGVDDVYVRRAGRRVVGEESSSWDEALKTVELPFAKAAADIFRRHSSGNPERRAFYSIYAGSPLGRMSIRFKKKHLKIYTVDQSPEAERFIREQLEPTIAVSPWGSESTKNSGFTFTISTPEQLGVFLKAVGDSET